MRDRRITSESVIDDANFRHRINAHLVEGWFGNLWGVDRFEAAKQETPALQITVDSAVAVLDVPREELITRAEFMDKSPSNRSFAPLATYYANRLAAARHEYSEDKAQKQALSELAGKMTEIIVTQRLRAQKNLSRRNIRLFAGFGSTATMELF